MAFITQGRVRGCKNTIGGIKSIYLAPYFKVLRSEVIYDGVTITQFPETVFYKFEIAPSDAFTQTQTESEGGKYYEVSLSVNFNKISLFDNNNLQKLLRKDYFLIVEDNNFNFFLLGFRNGITAESLRVKTTQYTIDFTGQEENIAPFVTGIMGTDIIIFDGDNKVFQDGNNFIFEDNNNYIFQ